MMVIKMRKDHLKNTDITLYQDEKLFKYNSDTTALGMSLDPMKGKTVLDIGTNNGALLIYAYIQGAKKLIGCDVFEEALEIARKNLEMHTDDFKLYLSRVQDLDIKPVDVIICNPPYFEMNSARNDKYYRMAMFEESLPLEDMFKSFRRLMKDNGVVYTLYPADRFPELFAMAIKYKMKFMKIRFVHDKRKEFALRVIVKMKIGPMTKTRILNPIYIDKDEIYIEKLSTK